MTLSPRARTSGTVSILDFTSTSTFKNLHKTSSNETLRCVTSDSCVIFQESH